MFTEGTEESIEYGSINVPFYIYLRALDAIRLDKENDHWFWQGAKSGVRDIPQMGCTISEGKDRLTKVINVARLIFVVVKGVVPYQVRRDKALCKEKLCVNPDHHYMIMIKPKKPSKGGRSRNHPKIRGRDLENIREVDFDHPKVY